MTSNWLRRAVLAGACVSAALLAACGSSTTESQLTPARVVAFGDAFSDLGQGGSRYTVNDGSANIWAQQVAGSFGLPLTPSAAGGKSYARGSARITAKPDAGGSSTVPTVAEQINTFLASDSAGANDLIIINGGYGDIIAEMAGVTAGTQTSDQFIANVRQAGRDLGAQVRRLVQAGGRHVVVVGLYDMSKSPWALSIGGSLLASASSKFNEELLVSIVDLGASVLYVDVALHFNLVVAAPSTYSLTDVTNPVCTSFDPGTGIGTGRGQVNSALCTTNTITGGVDYSKFLFADRVYPTPQGHRAFGDYAYTRIRARW